MQKIHMVSSWPLLSVIPTSSRTKHLQTQVRSLHSSWDVLHGRQKRALIEEVEDTDSGHFSPFLPFGGRPTPQLFVSYEKSNLYLDDMNKMRSVQCESEVVNGKASTVVQHKH